MASHRVSNYGWDSVDTPLGRPIRIRRFLDGHWEFNESHRDFQSVADSQTARVRYVIHLFAKEVVMRNFGRPSDAEVLERMVEVLTRLGAGK